MTLECPNCETNYRIAPSSFGEWKSARIRCRKCGNSFTIDFPATEPPEPPQRPRALTVPRGTPVTAFRPDPPTPVSPVLPPEPSHRSSVQPAGALGVPVAEELAPATWIWAGARWEYLARKEPPPASPREVDLLPHPQGTPEDSSGIDLPHPPSDAGDDTPSVLHTEAPPILPLRVSVTPRSKSWSQNSRSFYWSLLAASVIVVACSLAAAGLVWALATKFIPM